MSYKRCARCKEEKDLNEFNNHRNGKLGKHHYCRECISITKKDWYKSDPKIRSVIKWKRNIRVYGITEDDFNEMLVNQDFSCVICNNKFKSVRKTFIDHDHKTGETRALLCARCNSLIGLANDEVDILDSAIEYIRMFIK